MRIAVLVSRFCMFATSFAPPSDSRGTYMNDTPYASGPCAATAYGYIS